MNGNRAMAADELRRAECAIERALRELNEDRTACAACGLNKYDDHAEHLMAEALRGALGRCRRVRLSIQQGGA